jgi:hypothetical protein
MRLGFWGVRGWSRSSSGFRCHGGLGYWSRSRLALEGCAVTVGLCDLVLSFLAHRLLGAGLVSLRSRPADLRDELVDLRQVRHGCLAFCVEYQDNCFHFVHLV